VGVFCVWCWLGCRVLGLGCGEFRCVFRCYVVMMVVVCGVVCFRIVER